jgi:hypothetical protein
LGRTPMLANLVDIALPHLVWYIQCATEPADSLLLPTLKLLRDLAEIHLTALPPESASRLYTTTATTIKAIGIRLQTESSAFATSNGNTYTSGSSSGGSSNPWEDYFRADILLYTLETLNLLANQVCTIMCDLLDIYPYN